MAAARVITLRRGGRCAACGAGLDSGMQAWWDPERRSTTCTACQPPQPIGGMPPITPVDLGRAPSTGTAPDDRAGPAGERASERRRSRREDTLWGADPRLGGLILALTDEPATTTPWAVAADGERRIGATLDGLVDQGVVPFHGRRVPGSTRVLDHLAVGPSGVYVIDAKPHGGQVSKRDVGGWFNRDVRLFVGRRDCSRLLVDARRQADEVRAALSRTAVPIIPLVCFVEAEWGLFAKPMVFGDVHVAWPKALGQLVARPGPLAAADVDDLAAAVGATFPGAEPAPAA